MLTTLTWKLEFLLSSLRMRLNLNGGGEEREFRSEYYPPCSCWLEVWNFSTQRKVQSSGWRQHYLIPHLWWDKRGGKCWCRLLQVWPVFAGQWELTLQASSTKGSWLIHCTYNGLSSDVLLCGGSVHCSIMMSPVVWHIPELCVFKALILVLKSCAQCKVPWLGTGCPVHRCS